MIQQVDRHNFDFSEAGVSQVNLLIMKRIILRESNIGIEAESGNKPLS
jgi:hypothetical protein